MANITLRDGSGGNLSVGSYTDANGNIAIGHVPLVGGLPVAAGNPLPVVVSTPGLPVGSATAAAQATSNAALGAPADAEATGDGTIIGLLKRLRTLLAGLPATLGVKTAAGSLSVVLASDQPGITVTGSLTDTQLRATPVAVAGNTAVGAAPTQPPLSVAGTDAGGLKRHLLTDTAGAQLTVTKGGTTTTVSVVVLPAGVATQVVAANANRRSLGLANISTGLASMGFANTVTVGAGWPLAAAGSLGDQGGGYEWAPQAVHVGAVWAISTAGTSICVLEG